jgi:hypothetical protein
LHGHDVGSRSGRLGGTRVYRGRTKTRDRRGGGRSCVGVETAREAEAEADLGREQGGLGGEEFCKVVACSGRGPCSILTGTAQRDRRSGARARTKSDDQDKVVVGWLLGGGWRRVRPINDSPRPFSYCSARSSSEQAQTAHGHRITPPSHQMTAAFHPSAGTWLRLTLRLIDPAD